MDVTLVRPTYSDWEAVHGKHLPKHQAIMALEADHSSFAINTGTDGDLSRSDDWHILAACNPHSAPLQRMPMSVKMSSKSGSASETREIREEIQWEIEHDSGRRSLKHGKHPKLQYASLKHGKHPKLQYASFLDPTVDDAVHGHCAPTHACPALIYDAETGDYYETGGGETQDGPYRPSTQSF